MLIFKAMAFSSRGHNIFNNQYKMATVIHDREGVGREARGACGWQRLPQPEGAQAGCSGGGQRRMDPLPLVHTPRPAHGRPAAPRGGPEGAGHFPACDAQARPRLLRQGARRRRGLSVGRRGVGPALSSGTWSPCGTAGVRTPHSPTDGSPFSSLGARPSHGDAAADFGSWKHTEDLLPSTTTAVFANNPTSLETWHVHPAAM